MRNYFLMQAEPGEAGGGAAPELFDAAFVQGLREENKHWREQAESALRAWEQAEAQARVAAEQAAALQESASARVMQAELRAAARQAGMVDLDGLKLADVSALQIAEDGAVLGVEAVLDGLKAAKPWLFGVTEHSAAVRAAPRPRVAEVLDARRMSEAEYKAARARLVVGK